MSTFPPGNRKAHDTFCRNDNWVLVRDAKGGTVQHRRTYGLSLSDGRTLRTRISRPVDATDHGPTMWSQILREQLIVSQEQFWNCVTFGKRPDRESRAVAIPNKQSIPAGVVEKLIRLVGLSEEEVGAMTRDEAIGRLDQYWTDQA
ncbi:cytotoxic translational repressor of toxin-antitoxin stability system [Nocardia noduli]|uniref:cytotoxic translational repressor of toxin-antitoxin stability system n=1 Tax=Nocardia noduli TaxID=2815722 RepID=UPI0020B1BD7A|nr:cytotoxic translational repressor of toxin-antitoxin stability system [Nocardia noduli]